MTSSINHSSKKEFYPFDNWVIRRELRQPLEAEHPSESKDYSTPTPKVALWERLLFWVYTGLDLRIVRELKVAYSPRFKQLKAIAVADKTSETQGRPHAASELIRLKTYFQGNTLEGYWVDRELSVLITNLDILEETLRNYRLTWCQGKNSHPQSTDYQLLQSHPIESEFSSRVLSRSSRPSLAYEYEPNYDEETDTLQAVLWDDSVFKNYACIFTGLKTIDNWACNSLEKRLQQDIERRQQDPHCRLLFAYNDIYEERLKKRHQMITKARWVTGVALISLIGIAFLFTKIRKTVWLIQAKYDAQCIDRLIEKALFILRGRSLSEGKLFRW